MENEELESWLQDQVEDLINMPQYQENPSDMRREGEALRAAAASDGISLSDLTAECGGDIERYLLDKQNAFTDAEVRRKASKD